MIHSPAKDDDRSISRLKASTPLPLRHSRNDVSPLRLEEDRKSFVPCSVEEYDTLTQRTYWVLGGLGPVHVGTEEWNVAKRGSARQRAYGRAVQLINSHTPSKARTPERTGPSPTRLSPVHFEDPRKYRLKRLLQPLRRV